MASGLLSGSSAAGRQERGERPKPVEGVAILNPRGRLPVSLIIDDSTSLVNLAHFAIPQFAEVFPDQYKQPWRELPREIPDAFVRRFADWCAEHHVRGKYSMVPFPACVGWLDRDLPGWSKRDLEASLELVRRTLAPTWDIHPEMVSHTWAIDTRTGRPFPERSAQFMENWGFSQTKSADELADYMAYALRVLRNIGLRCEGITTPGGFGGQNRDNLARATLESVQDVGSAEIPHYFRDLFTDERSVAPRVQLAADLEGDRPRCVVSIIGCTGDWFGGWDGLEPGRAEQFITEDGKSGRLPQIIARGEPAILVGHWPGFYFNGTEHGFKVLQTVVGRLESHYDHLIWMNLSEIARYWAARELTRIEPLHKQDGSRSAVRFHAPFACRAFTLRIDAPGSAAAQIVTDGLRTPLREVHSPLRLLSNTFCRDAQGASVTACFDLPRGVSSIELAAV